MIEIFMAGSPVVILGGRIKATIISINIKNHNYIQYECCWWVNGERKSGWFEQIEVGRVDSSATQKIGFIK